VNQPLAYYEHNVYGTLNLLQLLAAYNCRRLVFSSSATVYGDAEVNPVLETAPLRATNPYGRTKLVIEEILRDVAAAPVPAGEQAWKIVILRYFNPIGAHPSGRIGEDPMGHPNNLLPFVMQVAVGRRPELSVFGGDYPTKDGTAIRDYIHVEDLARGHVAAIDQGILGDALQGQACDVFNLGSGVGVSVKEVIAATEKACGKPLPHKSVVQPSVHSAAACESLCGLLTYFPVTVVPLF
jgi:UDP-glucose 4-epimerase